jgi:hypothetical protein
MSVIQRRPAHPRTSRLRVLFPKTVAVRDASLIELRAIEDQTKNTPFWKHVESCTASELTTVADCTQPPKQESPQCVHPTNSAGRHTGCSRQRWGLLVCHVAHLPVSPTLPQAHTHTRSASLPFSSHPILSPSTLSITSSANPRNERSTPLKNNKAQTAIRSSGGMKQHLFAQVQEHCCDQTSTAVLRNSAKQYTAAHELLISRYCSLFDQQADIPSWSEHSRSLDGQLRQHINNFSSWLQNYSYMKPNTFRALCLKLRLSLPAEANMFDAMLAQGVDLHDAYIMDTSGDESPTFAVYREMQELAPPVIQRILNARVTELTEEGRPSARRSSRSESECLNRSTKTRKEECRSDSRK